MNNLLVVNKHFLLDKTYTPPNLVPANSIYKDNITIVDYVLTAFEKMKEDAQKENYQIDIMSGYRSYDYQNKIYTRLVHEKGLNYVFRKIAKPGSSEHQTGLALDFCIYKDEKCYIENEITSMEETKWVHQNAHKYGFIVRYPEGKEDITGYDYEPWHLRYTGKDASKINEQKITLEEYVSQRE